MIESVRGVSITRTKCKKKESTAVIAREGHVKRVMFALHSDDRLMLRFDYQESMEDLTETYFTVEVDPSTVKKIYEAMKKRKK